MKKTIASGLIGLIALGGGVALAAPAFAQEVDDSTRQEMHEARHAEKVETLSTALGVSAEELQTAKDAGMSLADIAAAEGVDLQSVIDSLVANAQARIDAKIAAGDIDADRAAEKTANLEERITARVNGEGPERGEGFGRGHHGPRGGVPTADAGV